MLLVRVLLLLLAAQNAAWAGEDENIALGRKLLAEKECNGACHQSRSPDGDALSLYTRPNRKVKDFTQLQRQVTRCVSSQNAMLSADEIADVAAALNHDFYKFQ